MAKFLVSLSYRLEVSKHYNNIKTFVYNILENNSYPLKKYFDFFMIFLVLSTVGILIFEVNHETLEFLNVYEYFAIVLFILEWLGRFWVSSNMHEIIIKDYEKAQMLDKEYCFSKTMKEIATQKLKFVFSPASIIDLLAIIPYYRPLRILRILLIFRLFKILRYTDSVKNFSKIFVERRFEFYTLIVSYTMVVFFTSTIMFIYEGAGVNEKINTFFDAVYWSIITISTVGYGDVTPLTMEGRLVTLVLIVSGFLVIAFGTSIITSGLVERMESIKEERVETSISKITNYTLICGFGVIGKILCSELDRIKEKFIILDLDEKAIRYAKEKNYLALKADATNMTLLQSLGVGIHAKNVIALTNDDAINLSIILSIKTLNNKINIIARAHDETSEKKFKIAGANEVIAPNELSTFVASEYIGQPVAFEAIDAMMRDDESTGANIDEIEISENLPLINSDVREIDFKKYKLTLLGIVDGEDRTNFIFNPLKEGYKLKKKDILILIGYQSSIEELKLDILSSYKNLKG